MPGSSRSGGRRSNHNGTKFSATNRDLERAVREGAFQEDLYYRLTVFPLRLPPLCEHGDGVQIIAENIIESLSRRTGGENGAPAS